MSVGSKLVKKEDITNLLTPTELHTLASEGMTAELITSLSSSTTVYIDITEPIEAYEAIKALVGESYCDGSTDPTNPVGPTPTNPVGHTPTNPVDTTKLG